jgi:hypothetical protein
MRAYAVEPSCLAGETITLGVEPGKRFMTAVLRQETSASLQRAPDWLLVASSRVRKRRTETGGRILLSDASTAPERFDMDWLWPTITLLCSRELTKSGAYAVAVYEVDERGNPTDDFGRKIIRDLPVLPHPPDSDNMALVIVCPYAPPRATIAYVVPIATYQAYNLTGGGCFYGYKGPPGGAPYTAQTKVTIHRPGGGLGAFTGEPPDPYDRQSPRQQFAHWDAKFIRWMGQEGIPCDFYTDFDLHGGALDLSRYQLMVSVGHHEYWSQTMRDQLHEHLQRGGNYACFSGNTCFRPINWGFPRTEGFMKEVNKISEHWPSFDEAELIGLSYGFGGGRWGNAGEHFGEWTDCERPAYGFTVAPGQSGHWVFANTMLRDGDTFGAEDRLVGYETDGAPPNPRIRILAQSPPLEGFNDNFGRGTLGVLGNDTESEYKTGLVFNAGTTDWARVLTDPVAKARPVVETITRTVLRTLSSKPD